MTSSKKILRLLMGLLGIASTIFQSVAFAQDSITPTVIPTPTKYKNLTVQKGNLYSDKPVFPAFYIWRRIYQKKEKSFYKFYLVDPNGNLSEERNPPVEYKNWYPSSFWNMDAGAVSISPGQKRKVEKPLQEDWDKDALHLKGTAPEDDETVRVPGKEDEADPVWGWNPIGWNQRMDYFYFFEVVGDSTGRGYVFYQLDPGSKTMTKIGIGQRIFINPKGNWSVWVDGVGGDYYATRQIHVYDILSNKDYVITKGRADNLFYGWAEPKNSTDIKPQ